ncbi:tetratricopeptide repeat protein [Streptomyces sp. NPDC020951]|uniref:tetratricopeptide repeat protein n=1 Tax=Streptomyces sp. NPDC020951 TaxID=3365104 RepID=UPI00379D550C
MEFDRRVQIRVRRLGKDRRGFGSGYLVAPRLVLTAAHVLDGMSETGQDPVTVSRPDAGEGEFPARVRWRRKDEKVDAALVEVDDGHSWRAPESLADLLIRPPQRWGRLIGTRPHPIALVGYPRMQKDPADGRRLDEQLTGHINPGTGSLAGRYEVSSTDPTLSADPPAGSEGSRWSGMSGAAVLNDAPYGGDLLCGVIRRDRQASGGTRLTATPAAFLLADEGFRALVTEHTGWEPVLEPVEPASLLTSAASERDLRSPAALLRADAEAVTFHGRTSELADLRTWCQDGPPSLAVHVLTGPGGQGKTRLARHLTDTLSRQDWATGHLRPDLTDHGTPPDFAPLATALPLLLVVDYAETRPRLLRRLITHLYRSRHPVRVLLLARSDGEWRTDALNADPRTRSLLKSASVTGLAPLIPRSRPTKDRITAFTRAACDLARLLPRVPTVPAHDWAALAAALRPSDDLSHARYDNALTLQLTALVTLLQHGPAPVETSPGAPAEEILLEHEERFWEDSADVPAFKLNLPTSTLATAVAVAALCGATSRDEALDVIKEVPDLPADKAARTTAWLAQLYPAEPDRYWGSLQPDRIAEYHASRTLARDDISLPALLAAAAPGQQAQLITVLARAAIAHYNAHRIPDSKSVLRDLNAALDTVPLHIDAVEQVTAAVPARMPILGDLGLQLTDVLVSTYRQLVCEDPAAFAPDLARSLSNLGLALGDMGRRAEALTAAEQAVAVYRRLAHEDPDAYEPELANAMSGFGIQLSRMGRRQEALGADEESLEIRQRLARRNPAAFEPDVAQALSNLGNGLSAMGRHGESLDAEQRAVEIYRRLARRDPAAYEADLATSLSNFGNRLAHVGRRQEALAAGEEALEIQRRLALDNLASYEFDVASSLNNLSHLLSDVGRIEEAVDAAEQAVDIYRRLARANPAAYEPYLATSLNNLGNWLWDIGITQEALAAGEEALEIRQRLALEHPAVYEPEFAGSLANISLCLSDMGRIEEALTAAEQAVGVFDRLAHEDPAAHEPNLARALSDLSPLLSDVGRTEEALAVEERTVCLYRQLARDDPAAYEPGLAASLNNLGNWLMDVGRMEDALEAEEQAVDIYRRLARANPAASEPDLGAALTNLARVLRSPAWVRFKAQPDLSGALRVTGEAVELYRRLVAARPTHFGSQLGNVLRLQAYLLTSLGRHREAEEVRDWLAMNAAVLDLS